MKPSKAFNVRLIKEWQAFSLAMQLLTIFPCATGFNLDAETKSEIKPEIQGRSLIWYPVVGLILGGLLTLLCSVFPLPFYLTATVVVAIWVILTGGLHLDGLADCADAWMGGLGDRDKTLGLLKDPLCGSMGVLSLVLVLLLKTAALAAMIYQGSWLWLWAVPIFSRGSLLWLFLTTPYVRLGGLGEVLALYFPKPLAWIALLVVGLVTLLILPPFLWFIWSVVVLLVFFGVRRSTMKRLQGFTGDVAGAQVELVEVALLTSACFIYGG